MGSTDNRGRRVWQDYSGTNAAQAEHNFFDVFNRVFEGTSYRIRAKPNEFKNLYVDVNLTDEELSEIYIPDIEITKHGINPDYAIDNMLNGKTLYIEVKRQDGWIEGKERSAGRGNAHERSCKYFTPGLLKALREKGKLTGAPLPFWTVFQGDITRDPCRTREIKLWYQDFSNHYFMRRDSANSDVIVNHFNNFLKRYLE